MPKFDFNFNFVPVPLDFIENEMPLENGTYVKIYLFALSLGMTKKEMTTAEIAQKMNLLESDVVNALEHWKSKGVLDFSQDGVTFAQKEDNEEPLQSRVSSGKSIKEITEEMTQNKTLADLCTVAQMILEKPLKNKDIETLYWFYDELGLSPEVITMLLEYCVSKNKRNMNYIEKVAISWHENGIVTLEAADKYITSEKEKSGYFYSLKKLFGFDDRNFSKTEETYLKTWRETYGMNEDMVGLAYEYCVMQINKISFPYMDSIIKRWHELGINTVAAAEKDHEDFKAKGKQKNQGIYGDTGVDYSEIEKLMRDKM